MGDPVVGREESLALLREHLPVLRRRFGVCELALFGSTARDQATADSDVDILVSFEREPDTSWGCYTAQSYLTEIFGRQVDLVERRQMRKEYLPWVDADAVDPMNPRPHMPERSRPKRWDIYIQDMLDACVKVMRYTADVSLEEYLANSEKRDATNLNVMRIGESAGSIPEAVRELHPEIDWGETMGLRNRIAHAYPTIDDERIWTIVHDDIPPMIPRLNALLAEAQAEAEASSE